MPTLQELIAQSLPQYANQYGAYQRSTGPGEYWYDPNIWRVTGDDWQRIDNGPWGNGPQWSDDQGTYLQDGVLRGNVDPTAYANDLARQSALRQVAYAGPSFDSTLDLIRRLDPNATEEGVFAAAQRASEQYDAPGKYMPNARITQRVADNYMTDKLGTPFSLESIPGVPEWINQQEGLASNTKLTWKEAAPYLAMFAAAWAGGGLLGAEGAGAAGATSAAPTSADVYAAALAEAGVTGAEASSALQSLLAYDAATAAGVGATGASTGSATTSGAGSAGGNGASGWVSGSDLPSGIYDTSAGTFAPSSSAGLTAGDYIAADGGIRAAGTPAVSGGSGWVSGSDLPSGVYDTSTGAWSTSASAGLPPGDYLAINGSVIPAGTLAPTQLPASAAAGAGVGASTASNALSNAKTLATLAQAGGMVNGLLNGNPTGGGGGGGGGGGSAAGLLGTGERYTYQTPTNVRREVPSNLLTYGQGPEQMFFTPEYFEMLKTKQRV